MATACLHDVVIVAIHRQKPTIIIMRNGRDSQKSLAGPGRKLIMTSPKETDDDDWIFLFTDSPIRRYMGTAVRLCAIRANRHEATTTHAMSGGCTGFG